MNVGKRIGMAALAAVTALGLAGCDRPTNAQGPQPAAEIPEVGVVVIQPSRAAMASELAGRVAPYLASEIRPQVGGVIQKRLFREGADVKAGDLLYQIDPDSYEAAVDKAKAALARSQAAVAPARLKFERYRELLKNNAISRQDHDEAEAAFRQAEAAVASDKAALQTAMIDLAHTRVVSPIPGRIGRSAITPGALVTASQEAALAMVQQIDPVYVDLTQSSADLLRLKRALASGSLKRPDGGQPKVRLLFEDGSPYAREGRLQLSEVMVDQGTGMVTLRALFPNPDHDLLPGMYVRAVVEEAVNEQAILAPQQCVQRDAKGNACVLVVGPEDRAEVRPVRVERAVGDQWLIAEGLQAGDRVLADGFQKAQPGAPVKAVPAGAR